MEWDCKHYYPGWKRVLVKDLAAAGLIERRSTMRRGLGVLARVASFGSRLCTDYKLVKRTEDDDSSSDDDEYFSMPLKEGFVDDRIFVD